MNFLNSSFWNYIPPVVKNVLIINVILFIATYALSRFEVNLNYILGMHYWQADKFNITQLISYMFMHGGLTHVFFNMFALVMFGSLLERTWGSRRFLLYYIVTGIGAGIIQQIIWTIDLQSIITALNEGIASGSAESVLPYEAELRRFLQFGNLKAFGSSDIVVLKQLYLNAQLTVGASGSIFGILLAFGWLFPQAELYMFFIPVPIKARLAVTIYAVAELFFGVANFSWDNIAHFAHLGGMLFGAILILIWRKQATKF
jgi:Uncharacterized membrane protein (homolog of Drosophila rhomboid)